MKRIVSASPVQQVTSTVIEPQAEHLGTVDHQIDLDWPGFMVNMEYYSVMSNRVMEEHVQRMYMNEGHEGHLAMSLLNHLERKILRHSGFLPISDKTMKVLAGETHFDVKLVETLLEILVRYNFFDIDLAKQDILTSMSLQTSALRYGHNVPTVGVRIPLSLLLAPGHERTKYCVSFDTKDPQLVRAYSKKKYGEICTSYEDSESMQLVIDGLAPRFMPPHYAKC